MASIASNSRGFNSRYGLRLESRLDKIRKQKKNGAAIGLACFNHKIFVIRKIYHSYYFIIY